MLCAVGGPTAEWGRRLSLSQPEGSSAHSSAEIVSFDGETLLWGQVLWFYRVALCCVKPASLASRNLQISPIWEDPGKAVNVNHDLWFDLASKRVPVGKRHWGCSGEGGFCGNRVEGKWWGENGKLKHPSCCVISWGYTCWLPLPFHVYISAPATHLTCKISGCHVSLPLSTVFSPGDTHTVLLPTICLLRTTSMIFTAGIPFWHLQPSWCCHKEAARPSLTQSHKSLQTHHKQEKMSWRTGWLKRKMSKADEFWFTCGQNHGSFPVAWGSQL